MLTNSLPEWLPYFNLGASVTAMVFAAILYRLWHRKLVAFTFFAGALVLSAGAAFQANLIPLDWWIILGTGGRALYVTCILLVAYVVTKHEK